MLRYILEDCAHEKVHLTDEVKYIQNYIFFQKQKDEEFKNISFEVAGNNFEEFFMEPMLFIPLVENAFSAQQYRKH